MPANESRKKGTFSNIRLGVARSYVFPKSRRKMMWLGGIGAGMFTLYFLFDALAFDAGFVTRGPLSSNHSNIEQDCGRCHDSFGGVADKRCLLCHEKTNDSPGVYTFAAHYLYRSTDRQVIETSRRKFGSQEMECATCHPDHRGRDANITDVNDRRCTGCHPYGSFNTDHPDFKFARTQAVDDSTLKFTHIRHTKFVLEKMQKESGGAYIEGGCLYCHNAQADGKYFKPIDFGVHCSDCHLTPASESPSLKIQDASDPAQPGVETLDMIKARRGPGTMWTFSTNPNEFIRRGASNVVKSPVRHKDPWVLENLKSIRRTLYPNAGLADLLQSWSTMDSSASVAFYREAIVTLQEYVKGLRNRPEAEVQSELTIVDSVLKSLTRDLSEKPELASGGLFSLRKPNPDLTPAQRENFEELASQLTRNCQECHYVASASIVKVRAEQRTLVNGEFDHRAHILERRCLDCHTEIPVAQVLVQKDTSKILFEKDRAAVLNIPRMSNCMECHSANAASSACVTCHFMHPNKTNRSNLRLFVDTK